jgi:uncharacterized damage-inducible protein DinB
MSLTSLLDEALEAWQYTRAGVIDEVENLSDADLRFRPHADSRTAAELVVHLAESGVMMAGELTKLLKRTHAEGDRKIHAAGELFMLQLITRFDGERGTRLAWMNHGISHEDYHRGQIALYARLVGRVPALTQRILGMA